jgi:hypothetical protein
VKGAIAMYEQYDLRNNSRLPLLRVCDSNGRELQVRRVDAINVHFSRPDDPPEIGGDTMQLWHVSDTGFTIGCSNGFKMTIDATTVRRIHEWVARTRVPSPEELLEEEVDASERIRQRWNGGQ